MNLQVKNLEFAYGARKVLNISAATFELGQIYGIVGKNGVGKTTFFKSLVNIITNYNGDVLIDGQTVKGNPEVLTNVGIVLDDMELYKNRTGLFNLRYFGELRGNFNEERALELAAQLEIADNLNDKVSSYSLGMNKKLILLISLMNDAQILIFDEPFRALDMKTVEWFREYLLNLKNEKRMILISSHVQEDIKALADKVLVLSNGDFTAEFDLKDTTQNYLYSVEVNDKAIFISLLAEREIAYSEQNEWLKFELSEAEYMELFKLSVVNDVEFYQIKKESKFIEFVK